MTRIAHLSAAQCLAPQRAKPYGGGTRRDALALAVVAACAAACAGAAQAQSPAATTAIGKDPTQTISITGSRVSSRVLTETSTPVDVVRRGDLAATGQVQLQNALGIIVPSFSVSKPSTAGALDFTSSPTLRGLGPGDTLLLLNGKRRHSMPALNLNNQIGRGDVGYDFNTLPPAAIARIDVLRDGASAIYGADAVAGVINVVLDKSLGGVGSVQFGTTGEGDGQTTDVSAGFGIRLGENGVLRTTVQLNERKRSNRAEPDTRQQYFGTNPTTGAQTTPSGNFGSGTGLTPPNGTLSPREATVDRDNHWLGDSPFKAGTVFINGELPLGRGATLYSFGGYSRLKGTSQGFFRRAGDDRTVRALYPNGYRPYTDSTFENTSLAVGARGEGLLGFDWDISTLVGKALLDDRVYNSLNASLGATGTTDAYVGGQRFSQWTSNFDLSREVGLGMTTAARFATGAEFRREYYESVAGEPDSYRIGTPGAILDGPNAGRPAAVGMQMQPGLTPGDVRKASRTSAALYAEIEQDLSKDWVLTGAARFERFGDFGNNSTYKLSTRYKVTAPLSLRGSLSSGFKAPHLAQSFTSTTATNFNNFVPSVVRLLPVDNPAARSLGATDLKPAKSRNASLGFVWSQGPMNLTMDAYRIQIKDRLALSTQFGGAALTARLSALGYPGIDAVQFMTNAIDSTTSGIDITGGWKLGLHEMGTLTTTVAANFNKTKLDRIAPTPAPLAAIGITAPLFDLTQQVRVTESTPKDKLALGFNWKRGDWISNLNLVRYGKVAAVANTNLSPARIAVLTPGYEVRLEATNPPSANSQVVQVFGAKWITDVSAGLQLGRVTLTAGVNNLFDVYPDKNLGSTVASVAAGTNGADNAGIFPYPYISPFGYTGRAFFAKAEMKF